MKFDLLRKRKGLAKPRLIVPSKLPAQGKPEDELTSPNLITRVKAWVEKYKVQVYAFVIVIIVGLLAYLAGFARNWIVKEGSKNFVGLASPILNASDATVSYYDVDLTGLEIDSKYKVYKIETDYTGSVNSAAGELGFISSPTEHTYEGYFKWVEGENSLVYDYLTNTVRFTGEYSSSWYTADSAQAGVASLFGINAETLTLATEDVGSNYAMWLFKYTIDGVDVVVGKDEHPVNVVTDGNGTVLELSIPLISVVDSKSISVLRDEELSSVFDSLPKQISAEVYSSELPEFNEMPISEPAGRFEPRENAVVLYKSLTETSFLVPVLCLKGTLTTPQGASGDATVLVDIVDWEKI